LNVAVYLFNVKLVMNVFCCCEVCPHRVVIVLVITLCVCALAYRVNCRYLPENTPVKCRYHVNCRHRQL